MFEFLLTVIMLVWFAVGAYVVWANWDAANRSIGAHKPIKFREACALVGMMWGWPFFYNHIQRYK